MLDHAEPSSFERRTTVFENNSHHLCLDHLCFFFTAGSGICLFMTWRLVVSTEVREPNDWRDSDFIHGKTGSGRSSLWRESQESVCCGGVAIRWFKSCSDTDELAWLVCVVYGFLPNPDVDGKKFGILYQTTKRGRKDERKKKKRLLLLYEKKIFLGLWFWISRYTKSEFLIRNS